MEGVVEMWKKLGILEYCFDHSNLYSDGSLHLLVLGKSSAIHSFKSYSSTLQRTILFLGRSCLLRLMRSLHNSVNQSTWRSPIRDDNPYFDGSFYARWPAICYWSTSHPFFKESLFKITHDAIANPRSCQAQTWKAAHHLCSGNSTSLTSSTLSRIQTDTLTLNNCLWLLNNFLALGQDQFDVARVGHVWVDLQFIVSICCFGIWNKGFVHGRGHGMFVGVAWVLGWLGCAWRSGCQCRDPWYLRLPLRSWGARAKTVHF